MNSLLSIIKLGNPILRQSSSLIENIQDEQTQCLIDNLIMTVANANGVGIAAPQVSISQRLFIVASRPNPRYPNAPEMEPTVMINPKIVENSTEIVKDWEGCLSIPGIRGLVPRYHWINVEYTDRNGELKDNMLVDFVARIFQHECDHLDGVVFLDRVESSQDLISEEEYQRLQNLKT
ncbi:peptide deformylase [Calothrix sp. UHCC 0171]|uniref:peptide deformylase n=1 Tax=Calothrix sp. UHCC 0171 TaxID=3110245 RepID=UPI002B1F7C0A|nr:peptide deformylase [Calothrix sp. UHCC 0171]MEA5572081.1 peptide deformylase [Calothrix sp. UHCC 0171]